MTMRRKTTRLASSHNHVVAGPVADAVEQSVADYEQLRPHLEAVTQEVAAQIRGIFQESDLKPLFVTSRTKSVESFREKASRVFPGSGPEDGENLLFPDPIRNMNDLVAVRVIVTLPFEIRDAANLIKRARELFDCKGDREKDTGSIEAGTYGYSSRHLILRTQQNDVVRGFQKALARVEGLPSAEDETAKFSGAYSFEVQIRTVFAHAWSEIEHDIRFKSADRRAWTPVFDRQFTATAAMLEKVEETFETLHENYAKVCDFWDSSAGGQQPLTPERIKEVWETLLPHVDRKFDDDWGWASNLLSAHDLTRTDQFCELLDATRIRHVRLALDHRYSPGPDRLLDDLLLWEFGQEHIDKTAGDEDSKARQQSLQRRLRQMGNYRRLNELREAVQD